MSALQQSLSLAAQKKLLPMPIPATGTFDVTANALEEHYQTKTFQDDSSNAILIISGRHTYLEDTIKHLVIRLPKTTRPGNIDLAHQHDTPVEVWYTVVESGKEFSVECTSGTLVIHSINFGQTAIHASLDADTESNPSGVPIHLKAEIDLSISIE